MNNLQASGAPDSEQFLDKALPSDEDAERNILAGIMMNNKLIVEVLSILSPADFYSPLYRRILEAMRNLHQQRKAIDPILIGAELKRGGVLESVGGVAAITNLTYGMIHSNSVKEYCLIVKEHSLARSLLNTCTTIQRRLLGGADKIDKILADATTTFIAFQRNNSTMKTQSMKQVVNKVRNIFEQWQSGNQQVSSLKTGIPELDGHLKMKGLALSELTLIGARPSTGKTALLLQIATHIIRGGTPALFVSLEMLSERLAMRMLPPITDIANKAINPKTFQTSPAEGSKLIDALSTLENLPMHFDRESDLPKLVATAEYYIQTQGVQLVVFDYLTLVKAVMQRGSSRDETVGYITNELKEIGIRNNVAVLGAAQLNRSGENEGARPKMSSFRESGIIEQTVDTALFPFDPEEKEHIKNPHLIENKMNLELFCAKQRDGQRFWTVPLEFDKDKQTLTSAEMRGESRNPAPATVEAPVIPSPNDDIPF